MGYDCYVSEFCSFSDHGYSSWLLLCSIQKPPTGRPRVSLWKIEEFGERIYFIREGAIVEEG
jgi:hypothetical protein